MYYGGLENRELKNMNSLYHLIVVIPYSVRKAVKRTILKPLFLNNKWGRDPRKF